MASMRLRDTSRVFTCGQNNACPPLTAVSRDFRSVPRNYPTFLIFITSTASKFLRSLQKGEIKPAYV